MELLAVREAADDRKYWRWTKKIGEVYAGPAYRYYRLVPLKRLFSPAVLWISYPPWLLNNGWLSLCSTGVLPTDAGLFIITGLIITRLVIVAWQVVTNGLIAADRAIIEGI